MALRVVFCLVVLLGVSFFISPKASAHFPITDGSMTVTLHIDPDDAPVAGQPSTIDFIYQDAANKFITQKCQCVLTISSNNKVLFSGPVPADNSSPTSIGALPYTFNTPAVYKLGLVGSPIAGGDFTPFKVFWDVRVPADYSAQAHQGSGTDKYYMIGFILIAVLSIGLIGYFIYNDFNGE